MEKINTYLENYEDLWQQISETDSVLPCGDISMSKIDESNFYGGDFSGTKSVYPIFFTGSSNYFPAICNCTNNKEEEEMDSCPVYIFDIASG